MEFISYFIFICMIFPMCLMLFILDKKPRLLVGYLLVGIFVCLFCSELNGIVVSHLNNDFTLATTTYTPLVEEFFKALPILYYAFVYKPDRKTLMMLAFVLGVGFAMLENMVYVIRNLDSLSFGFALTRGLCAGLMHSVCTMMVGMGIYFVHKKRKLFICGTTALLGFAATYHSVFNILVQSEYFWLGYIIPSITFACIIGIPFAKDWKKRQSKTAA